MHLRPAVIRYYKVLLPSVLWLDETGQCIDLRCEYSQLCYQVNKQLALILRPSPTANNYNNSYYLKNTFHVTQITKRCTIKTNKNTENFVKAKETTVTENSNIKTLKINKYVMKSNS